MVNLKCPNCHSDLELALLPVPDVSNADANPMPAAVREKSIQEHADERQQRFREEFPIYTSSLDLHVGIGSGDRPDDMTIISEGEEPDYEQMDVLAIEGYGELYRFQLKGRVVVLSAKDIVETILESGIAPNTTISGAYISLEQPSLGEYDHKLGLWSAWNAPLRRTVIDALKLRYPEHDWSTVTSGDAKRIVERLHLDHIGSAKQTGTKGIKWSTHSVPQDLDILTRTAKDQPELFKYWINDFPLPGINLQKVYSRISDSFESEFSDLFTNEI